MVNKKQISKYILLFIVVDILLGVLWMIITRDIIPIPFFPHLYLEILKALRVDCYIDLNILLHYYEYLIAALFLIIVFITRKTKEYFKNPFYNLDEIKSEIFIIFVIDITLLVFQVVLLKNSYLPRYSTSFTSILEVIIVFPILKEIIFKGFLYHLLLPKNPRKQILILILLSLIFVFINYGYYLIYFTPSIFKAIPSFIVYFFGILIIGNFFIYQYLTLKIYKKTKNLTIVSFIQIFMSIYHYLTFKIFL